MASVTRRVPLEVVNVVSRILLSGRYCRCTRKASTGCNSNKPPSQGSRRLSNNGGESRLGTHHQTTVSCGSMMAIDRPSPTAGYCCRRNDCRIFSVGGFFDCSRAPLATHLLRQPLHDRPSDLVFGLLLAAQSGIACMNQFWSRDRIERHLDDDRDGLPLERWQSSYGKRH